MNLRQQESKENYHSVCLDKIPTESSLFISLYLAFYLTYHEMLIENQLDCKVLTGEEFLNTTESFYVLTDLLRQYERKREEKHLFCSRYVLQQTRVI